MALPLAVPLAIAGISALGGLLSNRKKTLTGTQDQTTTENINRTTLPTYDPKAQIMRDLLMHQFLGRAEDQGDYWSGYAREGISNINRAADINQEAISNILANRGLGRTGAGATSLISNQLGRGQQIASLQNQIPLLADTRARQNLLDAGSFFGQLPVGQTMTGTDTRTSRGTSTQTDPGNMFGGAVGSLATTLGGLFGMGAFGGGGFAKGTYPNLPTIGSSGGYNYPSQMW